MPIVVRRTEQKLIKVAAPPAQKLIRVVEQGPRGPRGEGFPLDGSVDTYADLPVLTADDAGKAWLTNDDGRVYVWSGTQWPAEGTGPKLEGPRGADGAPGQVRFTGHGPPPTVIVGANPRDTYMNLDDGTLYKLA